MKAKRAPRAPRGQVLVLVALAMTVLLLIAGLVLDYGIWLVQERAMRNAADGAVQAGVSELVKRPITSAKQQNAATHAMEYLNDQLTLGLPPGQIAAAASHALLDANGFGSEDGIPGYTGTDHYLIRTPVTANVSCTGATWGERALTVRVQHLAPRFLSRLLFSGDQPINVCATASLEGNGYAIAVLKPNTGSQPNGQNISMKLAGQDSFVRICGGDVGINSIFDGGPNPPPNSKNQPAYVKFMKPNSGPACTIDNNNKMVTTIENPSPSSWSVSAKQVRVEGPTSSDTDDVYQAPTHLQNYIQIPTWGATYYAALNDGAQPTKYIDHSVSVANRGSCTAPGGLGYTDTIAPGKFDLIRTNTGQVWWLCPGVYHFVHGNGQQGLQIGQDSIIGGQGVTLVFETGPVHNQDDSAVSISSGGALVLNSPAAGGVTTAAPWRTGDPRHDEPISIWIKPDGGCPAIPLASCSASAVFVMGSGSGLDIQGIIFGPTDNMKIAGNGVHHGAGEIWAWTIEYLGNSQLDQVYEGDADGYPLIVE
jgi:Flp pilus assembly protein TadG